MRAINIGAQGFDDIREHNDFYVDKTSFIREWWESRDTVTLITRPRRFGKTLNMSMLECFFSLQYAGRNDLFEGLGIWHDERYQKLQGTFPVIFLSFANIKEKTYEGAREAIVYAIRDVFRRWMDWWDKDTAQEQERYAFMRSLSLESSDVVIANSLHDLSAYLEYRYGKKCLILLDEYDTPMQEAFIDGYWDQMSDLIRKLFNASFKTNPSLERALMTGITRVAKESIFSDLNNPMVITTTTRQYETAFGFTQQEVDASLEEYGLAGDRAMVREWYDGFTFGETGNIYNPWSIINYLKQREFHLYWANTSSNSLISYELRVSDNLVKQQMETLLTGGTVDTRLDEEIVFSQLEQDPKAIWSFFLAAGYLKVAARRFDGRKYFYSLAITNLEVRLMFDDMITGWFEPAATSSHEFIKAMISGDTEKMNIYMNRVALVTFSIFDAGNRPSDSTQPERFYHGFVLGLLVREQDHYHIRSNRESGYGRYDICLYPKMKQLPGIVIEFKVQDKEAGEKTLEDTAAAALDQIYRKKYATDLEEVGVSKIWQYGFAFCGKKVLIQKG